MSIKNRREFLKQLTLISAGLVIAPNFFSSNHLKTNQLLLKRRFGKIRFDVTTMGLGGQASIQWTPEDVDPVKIIEKAFALGINYYDTSNVYGPSQLNFGKAFRKLNLIPGEKNYNKELRESIFLTAKSGLRLAKGYKKDRLIKDMTDSGDFSSGCIADLKRTMTQIFGDGLGSYPKGAYINLFLVHNVVTKEDLDAIYTGYENPSPDLEQIGALAALLDYRDGTNKTGLNPDKEKLIRHLGFSGHNKAEVLMEMIQRDTKNILDAILLPINSNDLLYRNMQYNVIPVAKAKNMGVIAMKVFSNGLMYGKKNKGEVIRSVGSATLDYSDLIRYTVSTPGVDVTIIGIGQISDDPLKCQLISNLKAAQIKTGALSATRRRETENSTKEILDGKTNDFQSFGNELTPARNFKVSHIKDTGNKAVIAIRWDNALSGTSQLSHYEIFRNDLMICSVPFEPQTTLIPFEFKDIIQKGTNPTYSIIVTDNEGNRAKTDIMTIN